MKRRASKSGWPSLSLFPFLAVLICTMGILIVLLVVVTKLADEKATQAQQDAENEIAARLESATDQLEIEQIRVEQISRARNKIQAKLVSQQKSRSHVNHELRELEDQFESTVEEFQRLLKMEKQQGQHRQSTNNEAKIATLKKQIQQASRIQNELAQETTVGQPVVYSVVPSDTVDGTNRLPIYVECRAEGIYLQPTGILLKESDFERPILAGNPFDSSLLAIREYWNRAGIIKDGEQPYPLLIVRPGGANAYSLARRAMRNWDDQFGYELVENEKKLDFGKSDPALKSTLISVVEKAKRFQQSLAMFNQQRGSQVGTSRNRAGSKSGASGSNGTGGLRASRSGGFETENGNSPNTSFPQHSNPSSTGSFQNQTVDDQSTDDRSKAVGGNSHENQTTSNSQSPNSSKTKGDGTGSGENAVCNATPISQVRGNNWALPTRTAGAVAYNRPIKVICARNELILEPSAQTSNRQIRIPIRDDTQQSVEQLVEKVWSIIDSWGIAASGGYWKPDLVFRVQPDSQNQYREISKLLEGSGLEVMIEKRQRQR